MEWRKNVRQKGLQKFLSLIYDVKFNDEIIIWKRDPEDRELMFGKCQAGECFLLGKTIAMIIFETVAISLQLLWQFKWISSQLKAVELQLFQS